MSKNSDTSNVNRRDFLLRAGSIVATGYLVVGKAPTAAAARISPPTAADYVVTIDFTSCPQNPPIYSCVPPVTNAADASLLPVDPKQVVHWKAKVNTSGNHYHLALLFLYDTPFVDKHNNNKRIYAFHGSQADAIGDNAWIDPAANPNDYISYEYFVAVWDEDSMKTCTDDPTIMVGKGGHSLGKASATAKLIAAEGLVKKAAIAYPVESESINKIASELSDLIYTLKKPDPQQRETK